MDWLGGGGSGRQAKGRGGGGDDGGRGAGRGAQGRFEAAPDDWLCAVPNCGNVNYARRTECNRCKKPRGTGNPGACVVAA
jgi:RNA-binding protein FUS